MATARKSSDAAPADETQPVEAVAEPQTQVADPAPAAESAEASPVEEVRGPVMVTFNGSAQTLVAGVGLCDPGETYPVPAHVADAVCAGDSPLFTRAA